MGWGKRVKVGVVMGNNEYVGVGADDDGDESVGASRDSTWSFENFFPVLNEIAENDCSTLDEEHQYLCKK